MGCFEEIKNEAEGDTGSFKVYDYFMLKDFTGTARPPC